MNPSPSDQPCTPASPDDQPKASIGERLLSIFTPFIAGAAAMNAVDHIVAHKELNALFDLVCMAILLGTAWRWSRG